MCSFFLLFFFCFCSSFLFLFFVFRLLLFRLAFLRSGLFPGLLFYCAHWGLIKKSASRCQERPVSNTPARPLAFWPWNGNRADLEIWIGRKDVHLLCLRCWLVNLGSSFFCLFISVFLLSKVRSAHPPNLSGKCRFNFRLRFVSFLRFVSSFRLFFRFVFRLLVSFFVLFFVFFVFLSLLSSRLSSRHLFYAFPAASAPRALHEHEPSSDFRFRPRNETRNGNELIESVDRFKMDETNSKEIPMTVIVDGSC